MPLANPVEYRAYQADYYGKNREARLLQMRANYHFGDGKRWRFAAQLKVRGISAHDWANAWHAQKGLCCGCKTLMDMGQKTHMDHCHTTGIFRGLLCSDCNVAIGILRDSPETLRRLAAYLEISRD